MRSQNIEEIEGNLPYLPIRTGQSHIKTMHGENQLHGHGGDWSSVQFTHDCEPRAKRCENINIRRLIQTQCESDIYENARGQNPKPSMPPSSTWTWLGVNDGS